MNAIQVEHEAAYLAGGAPAQVEIPIAGMTCASCVSHIEAALTRTPGVTSASVNLLGGSAKVTYLPELTDVAALREAVRSIGYEAGEPAPAGAMAAGQEAEAEREYRTLMRKFWFAAIVSVPVMLFSYPDLVPGLRDWMPMGSIERRVVWAALRALALPVMLWSGSQFYTGMWAAHAGHSAAPPRSADDDPTKAGRAGEPGGGAGSAG